MDFNTLLQKRTCIRAYKDTPVTVEQMNSILEAGVRAPNACNLQSWHFYAVCDKELISAVHPEIAHIPWIDNISLLIVVCTDEKVVDTLESKFGSRGRMFAIQDTAGAINHMLLKAADLNLGGCWIGPMNTDKCRSHFKIAQDHTPVAILTIGTPKMDLPARDRKPIEEVITVIGELPGGVCGDLHDNEKPFELAHASLPAASFEDLNLPAARFDNVNLAGALFNNINMSGICFTDINMTGTSYDGLNLSGSRFGCVDFNSASFENPCFDGSVFKNCSFRNVTFENCEFDAKIVSENEEDRILR